MGNSGAKKLEGGEEEVRDTKVFDIRKIYWDKDGNLRHGRSKRNRDDEILTLLQKDHTDAEDKAALWIIIPNRWLRTWLIFAYMKMGEEPGKIDTKMLLTHDPLYFNNWRPLRTLKPPNAEKLLDQTAKETPGHYRRIHLEAWKKLANLYGVSGPVICVLGYPYDDLLRWRCFDTVEDIRTDIMPQPDLPEEETAKAAEPEKKKEEKGLLNNLF